MAEKLSTLGAEEYIAERAGELGPVVKSGGTQVYRMMRHTLFMRVPEIGCYLVFLNEAAVPHTLTLYGSHICSNENG